MFVAYVMRTCDERSFSDHDTFAAYLGAFDLAGYPIVWLSGKVAVIGERV